MSLISIAKETFYDAKSGKLVEDTKEVVRFGTFCSSGDMHVEFQVGGDLESELAGGQEVLLTKGEDFTEAHPPIRFQNSRDLFWGRLRVLGSRSGAGPRLLARDFCAGAEEGFSQFVS